MLYELINPSDSVTFHARDHQVACLVTALLGGMYSCKCCDDRDADIPGFFALHADGGDSSLKEFLGMELKAFLGANAQAVSDALRSFSYASRSERRMYDDCLAAITDAEKLEAFKRQHEDRERTSMNTIVKRAWTLADHVKG